MTKEHHVTATQGGFYHGASGLFTCPGIRRNDRAFWYKRAHLRWAGFGQPVAMPRDAVQLTTRGA
jgi:hypothetical protein